MRPPQNEPLDSQGSESDNRTPWGADSPFAPITSSTRAMRSEDSWVEISSRPSSSSLSSASNDIITTGLQVRPSEERYSRQPRASTSVSVSQPRATSVAGSSQDEYEESESESEIDPVLSSSNEDLSHDDNADDDDTSTALGIGSVGRAFTPQPNAFSHPPSSQDRAMSDSYFPPAPSSAPLLASGERTVIQRTYDRGSQSRQRSGTSSYRPDHDAALRASLTTLLSCAAAVRPKNPDSRATTATRPSPRPTALRLVPDSELNGTAQPRRSSSPKHVKRKSREYSKERQAKKARAAKAALANEELINPTLASWMISAGVVLVFSAISFSAGYAWGREVGKLETGAGLAGGSCGQEALRGSGSGSGLRRLRWSAAPSSING